MWNPIWQTRVVQVNLRQMQWQLGTVWHLFLGHWITLSWHYPQTYILRKQEVCNLKIWWFQIENEPWRKIISAKNDWVLRADLYWCSMSQCKELYLISRGLVRMLKNLCSSLHYTVIAVILQLPLCTLNTWGFASLPPPDWTRWRSWCHPPLLFTSSSCFHWKKYKLFFELQQTLWGRDSLCLEGSRWNSTRKATVYTADY